MDDDITVVISGIIHGTRPLDTLNKTNVALIRKVKNPTLIFEFRPISFFNVIYKLVSNVVANRLKHFFPGDVYDN